MSAGAEAQRRYLEFFAALRHLFHWLVTGHVLFTNPASFVRGPKFSYTQGKTPILTPTEARTLLRSIPTDSVVGLRDRALIGLIVYTFQPCRALIKRYQDKAPRAILDDLITSTPEDAGRWFATRVLGLGRRAGGEVTGRHRHPAARGSRSPGVKSAFCFAGRSRGVALDGCGPLLRASRRRCLGGPSVCLGLCTGDRANGDHSDVA